MTVISVRSSGRKLIDGATMIRLSLPKSVCVPASRATTTMRAASVPAALMGPVTSACACLRSKLPYWTANSPWVSNSGRLVTLFTSPPAVA